MGAYQYSKLDLIIKEFALSTQKEAIKYRLLFEESEKRNSECAFIIENLKDRIIDMEYDLGLSNRSYESAEAKIEAQLDTLKEAQKEVESLHCQYYCYNKNQFCEHHSRDVAHSTRRCRTLIRHIQEITDAKTVVPDTISEVKRDSNPMPNIIEDGLSDNESQIKKKKQKCGYLED